jgi:hypothetical protein
MPTRYIGVLESTRITDEVRRDIPVQFRPACSRCRPQEIRTWRRPAPPQSFSRCPLCFPYGGRVRGLSAPLSHRHAARASGALDFAVVRILQNNLEPLSHGIVDLTPRHESTPERVYGTHHHGFGNLSAWYQAVWLQTIQPPWEHESILGVRRAACMEWGGGRRGLTLSLLAARPDHPASRTPSRDCNSLRCRRLRRSLTPPSSSTSYSPSALNFRPRTRSRFTMLDR